MNRNKNPRSTDKFFVKTQAGDVVTKLMTYPATVSSTGAGSIVVTTISSDNARSLPGSEWASFAARYQSFRVKAVRCIFIPLHPTVDATATKHGAIVMSDTLVSNAPSTYAQVLSDENSSVHATHKQTTYSTDWSRNPNAKLWNPTNAAIPAANQFGIQFCGLPTELTPSIVYFDMIIEWAIEFRGSQ